MVSYLTIDRIEGEYAVCELESIDIVGSLEVDYKNRECIIVDVPVAFLENPHEGDIFVVDHQGEAIQSVLGKSCAEKARRKKYLTKIMG